MSLATSGRVLLGETLAFIKGAIEHLRELTGPGSGKHLTPGKHTQTNKRIFEMWKPRTGFALLLFFDGET